MNYEEFSKELSSTISRISFLKGHLTNLNSNEKHALEDALSEVIHGIHFSKLPTSNKQELYKLIEPCYEIVAKKLYSDLEYNRLENTLSLFRLQYNTKN